MKSNKKIIIFFLFIGIFFFNCKEKNELIYNINIRVCGVENPTWLLNQVSDILKKTSNFRPVKISVYNDINTEITSIEDVVNSNASKALMFFECSGKQVEFNSDKYKEYATLYKNKKFKLLWSN